MRRSEREEEHGERSSEFRGLRAAAGCPTAAVRVVAWARQGGADVVVMRGSCGRGAGDTWYGCYELSVVDGRAQVGERIGAGRRETMDASTQ